MDDRSGYPYDLGTSDIASAFDFFSAASQCVAARSVASQYRSCVEVRHGLPDPPLSSQVVGGAWGSLYIYISFYIYNYIYVYCYIDMLHGLIKLEYGDSSNSTTETT